MDKINSMRAFLQVVDSGTFTKTADVLDVPTSTVTRLIQSLEAELKTQLLNRTTRRVTVTTAGAEYALHARQILSDLDELEGRMTNARAAPRGRIRIDLGAALARLLVVPALPEFLATYPDIEIDIGGTDRLVDLVAESIDCAIRTGQITDLSLVARQIGELHYICCASPGYLNRKGTPGHPAELDGDAHEVLRYFNARASGTPTFIFQRDAEDVEVHGNGSLAFNDANVAVAACQAGLGIMRAPRYLVESQLRSGDLLPLLTDWQLAPLPIHIVYATNRYQSQRVRVFVDWIAALFERTPAVRRGQRWS